MQTSIFKETVGDKIQEKYALCSKCIQFKDKNLDFPFTVFKDIQGNPWYVRRPLCNECDEVNSAELTQVLEEGNTPRKQKIKRMSESSLSTPNPMLKKIPEEVFEEEDFLEKEIKSNSEIQKENISMVTEKKHVISKTCKRCGVTKSPAYDNFTVCASSADGLQSWCKKCISEYGKEKREAKRKERQKALKNESEMREAVKKGEALKKEAKAQKKPVKTLDSKSQVKLPEKTRACRACGYFKKLDEFPISGKTCTGRVIRRLDCKECVNAKRRNIRGRNNAIVANGMQIPVCNLENPVVGVVIANKESEGSVMLPKEVPEQILNNQANSGGVESSPVPHTSLPVLVNQATELYQQYKESQAIQTLIEFFNSKAYFLSDPQRQLLSFIIKDIYENSSNPMLRESLKVKGLVE